MKLTPLDIHHKEFRRALRGYNEEDVDIFLDEVAEEFERLFKENIDLKEQIERTQSKVQQYEGIEETLQKTLLTAQKSAEEVKGRAVEEAELIIKDAEAKARETLQGILKEREQVQNSFNELKKAEKDFRLKFRSLLESFLTMVNEIEGGTVEEKTTTGKRTTKRQPAASEGQTEGELARLLREIKMAKSEMEKETPAEENREGNKASLDKGEVDPAVISKQQEEEREKGFRAKKNSRGASDNPGAEVKEIS